MATSLYQRRLQSDEDGSKSYHMSKFDKDFNYLDFYTLTFSHMDEWVCSCPARTTTCRHVRMMDLFEKAEQGEDPIYEALSMNGKYVVFLKFDGKRFDWVQGPEVGEVEV